MKYVVALLAVLWGSGMASQALAADCPATPTRIRLHITAGEPVIDNSQSQEAVRALATQVHASGRMLGLYVGNINASAQPTYEVVQRGDVLCVRTTEVAIELSIEGRKIYVISERHPGTCGYQVVLDHERQHQAIDDELLREYSQQFADAVRRAVAVMGSDPIALSRKADAQRRLSGAMERGLRQAFARLGAERSRRQLGLDTLAEYQRITNACP